MRPVHALPLQHWSGTGHVQTAISLLKVHLPRLHYAPEVCGKVSMGFAGPAAPWLRRIGRQRCGQHSCCTALLHRGLIQSAKLRQHVQQVIFSAEHTVAAGLARDMKYVAGNHF
jgi:hypothetical protein